MNRIIIWWKQNRRYVVLEKSLLLALLPLACCFVYCILQGRSIGEVFLPGSEWNDELFYYKQVEGIINYGYPQGYFGFNESHAQQLSFAAWSPVLVFPWILWGKLFGWNIMSPIICNIFLMSLACFLFVWLVRPSWKQVGILTVLFCTYTPFVRYMLSVMPEVICFSMLIIFYSLAINYQHSERKYKLWLLFLLSGLLTLMRPYCLLFMLLPAWFWKRRSGGSGVVGSVVVMGGVLAAYGAIKHYFGAEYFAPLFFTDWVDAFLYDGIVEGARYTLGKLYYMGTDFINHTMRGFKDGLASGAFFAGFLVCMLVLVVQSLRDRSLLTKIRRGDSKAASKTNLSRKELSDWIMIESHLAFSFVAMLFALLLMYKLTEGSKHLLTFMAAAVFVIAMLETRFFEKAAIVGTTFVFFYTIKAVDPYDYQVPFVQEERAEALQAWEKILDKKLILSKHDVPSYDNVVIWTFSDEVKGVTVNTSWQMLYALPEGFGISCCMADYVKDNFYSLESKYICVVPGGDIEKACINAGYEKIAQNEGAVLFKRR